MESAGPQRCRNSGWREQVAHGTLSCCSAPTLSHNHAPWRTAGWRRAGCWPRMVGCLCQRNTFREPRALSLPTHKNTLSSLTWDDWFSLINTNFLIFGLPGFCCKSSKMPWLPACLFGGVPQSYLRGSSSGFSPQCVQWIKPNSQLTRCAFCQLPLESWDLHMTWRWRESSSLPMSSWVWLAPSPPLHEDQLNFNLYDRAAVPQTRLQLPGDPGSWHGAGPPHWARGKVPRQRGWANLGGHRGCGARWTEQRVKSKKNDFPGLSLVPSFLSKGTPQGCPWWPHG